MSTSSPIWQVHTAQFHQVVHGRHGHRSNFVHEDPNGDSVVFQRTLRDHITMHWQEGGQERHQAVGVGQAMLFGMPEQGGRETSRDSRYECQWLRITGAGLRAHWHWLRERFGRVVSIDLDGEAVAQASEICQDFEQGEAVSSRSVHRFVCLLTEELTLEHEARLPPTAAAIERIRTNPFRPWSLKALATKVGCTREHLTRLFTEAVGQPPATWLRERRLERAVRLIEDTEMPISEIARLCGFGSADTFGRLLRQQHGMAGSALRTAARERLANTHSSND